MARRIRMRVERLHEPALGARAPGQEDVGPPVEQHQDRDVGQVAVGLLEPQLEADGHAAHVAHLQVDDDEIGLVLGHRGGARRGRSSTSTTSVSGSPTTADDLGPHRRGVAGHQDRRARRPG